MVWKVAAPATTMSARRTRITSGIRARANTTRRSKRKKKIARTNPNNTIEFNSSQRRQDEATGAQIHPVAFRYPVS